VSNASLAVALPVLNLQKASEMGMPILTACASCYSRLRTANHKVREVREERDKVERITGKPYEGAVDVLHILDVLANHVEPDTIRQAVVSPLLDLKAASYYGCLLSRPPEIVAFESPDKPSSMDRLLEGVGATVVDWPFKTECCGAGLSMSSPDTVARLTGRLLTMARDAGAECLSLACPMCHVNLDLRQRDAIERYDEVEKTPILYVTQLLGLAFGIPGEELGINALNVSAASLLNNIGTTGQALQGAKR
jgi:heterodisulfide reductase subunit B